MMLIQSSYLINEVGKMFHLLYQIDQFLENNPRQLLFILISLTCEKMLY